MEFRVLLRQIQVDKVQDWLRRRRVQVAGAVQVLPRVLGIQHRRQPAVLV